MRQADGLDAILTEAVAGLAHLRADELEELGRRVERGVRCGGVEEARRLRPKLELLESCLVSTERDLVVLRQILLRERVS